MIENKEEFKDYSDFESKIHRSVFQNEENELSPAVGHLQRILSKGKKPVVTIPAEFAEILQKEKIHSQSGMFNFKNIAIGLSAVAAISIAVRIFWHGSVNENEKSQKLFSAKVTFLNGEVFLKSASTKDAVKLENGAEVYENQTIVTKDKSAIDLWLSVGTSIRIKENSEVVLKKLVQGDENIAELYTEKGKLLSHVHKNQKKSHFNIVSPTAIAGVRGTKFSFESRANKAGEYVVKLGVEEGRVALTKSQNSVRTEPTGEQVIEPGQKIEISASGFKRAHLTENEKAELSELNSVFIDNVAKKRLTGPVTEKQLRDEYEKLEKIVLDDKTVIRGVIIDMNENFMTIHTPNGEIQIDRTKVVEVDQIY